MLKKLIGLLSDAATYGASSMLSQVLGLFLLPLYTRHLSPSEYGITAMLAIVTAVFGPIANLGIQSSVFRNFNRTKDEAHRREVLGTGLVSVTVSSIALLLICLPFSAMIASSLIGEPSSTHLVEMTLVTAAATTIGTVPFSVMRANRKVKTVAIINVTKLVFNVGVTIVLVVVMEKGVMGVVVASLVGESVYTILQLAMTMRSYRLTMNWEVYRSMLAYGLPYVPHRLQGVGMVYFGQFVLAHMLSLEDAGLYNVALRFATPVSFAVNAFQNAWSPYKFEILAEDENPAATFRSLLTYYLVGVAFLWVGVCLWGPEILRFMTNARFHGAAVLVAPVALIPMAQGIRIMLGTGLEVVDDQRAVPVVTLAGLIVTVAASYLLTPKFGGFGAAGATTLGWVMQTCLIYRVAQGRYRIAYDWWTLSLVSAMALLFVAFALTIQNLSVVGRLGLEGGLTIAFPALSFLILSRSASERGRMRHLTERVARRLSPASRS